MLALHVIKLRMPGGHYMDKENMPRGEANMEETKPRKEWMVWVPDITILIAVSEDPLDFALM